MIEPTPESTPNHVNPAQEFYWRVVDVALEEQTKMDTISQFAVNSANAVPFNYLSYIGIMARTAEQVNKLAKNLNEDLRVGAFLLKSLALQIRLAEDLISMGVATPEQVLALEVTISPEDQIKAALTIANQATSLPFYAVLPNSQEVHITTDAS